MPTYSDLLDEERDQIAVMRAAGRSMGAIAQGSWASQIHDVARTAPQCSTQRLLFAAGAYQLRRRREAILQKDQTLAASSAIASPKAGRPNKLPVGSRRGMNAACALSGSKPSKASSCGAI